MTTRLITNSYDVQFVFDVCVIATTVFAVHEDAAIDMAADQIIDELGISHSLLNEAQEIVVSLLDEDVL